MMLGLLHLTNFKLYISMLSLSMKIGNSGLKSFNVTSQSLNKGINSQIFFFCINCDISSNAQGSRLDSLLVGIPPSRNAMNNVNDLKG